MRPAKEKQRNIVTSSSIGWTHAQNDPRISSHTQTKILRYSISHRLCTHFCCALFCCSCMINFWYIYMIHFTISFRVTSLALGQSYDCPSASEVILKDMGKINEHQTTTHIVITLGLTSIRHWSNSFTLPRGLIHIHLRAFATCIWEQNSWWSENKNLGYLRIKNLCYLGIKYIKVRTICIILGMYSTTLEYRRIFGKTLQWLASLSDKPGVWTEVREVKLGRFLCHPWCVLTSPHLPCQRAPVADHWPALTIQTIDRRSLPTGWSVFRSLAQNFITPFHSKYIFHNHKHIHKIQNLTKKLSIQNNIDVRKGIISINIWTYEWWGVVDILILWYINFENSSTTIGSDPSCLAHTAHLWVIKVRRDSHVLAV